jgi:type IV fimbrial biogenesis protein FimT
MLDHETGGFVLIAFPAGMNPPVAVHPLARAAGFTLVEMMIVVVIIAIATMLGIPSYRAWVQNTQIYNAATSVEAGLQKAKAEAVKRNAKIEFVLGANPPWRIQLQGNALPCPIPANTTLTTLLECATTEGAKNATAVPTPTSSATVTFNSLGGVETSNSDGSAPLTQIDFNSAVLPGSHNLRVTIGLGGITRMCDPNLATGSSPRAC